MSINSCYVCANAYIANASLETQLVREGRRLAREQDEVVRLGRRLQLAQRLSRRRHVMLGFDLGE